LWAKEEQTYKAELLTHLAAQNLREAFIHDFDLIYFSTAEIQQ